MNPTIRTAIQKRNKLRKSLRTKDERLAWLNACRDVNDQIRVSKTDRWRELLEEAATSTDDSKLWKVIKDLNGSPEDNAPNEAMIHKGRVITSSKQKADLFARHYAAVSRLEFSKEERAENLQLKKVLKSPSVEGKSCQTLKMSELKTAIRKMRRKGAAGPDDISPSFLKALGPKALTELLAIFNLSFASGMTPQQWRSAIIIPLLKQGKPASDLASFRPISLTSCIGKLLERIIADRLSHIAESLNLLDPQQAGFRKGRSCEDQIIRITQAIEDGFQMKPRSLRSVLVLLDFSKAYDTVWRQRLLLTMFRKGIPLPLIRWLHGFLQNRQAKVLFNNCTSSSVNMFQGLPQGSVLSPLLFLFYINSLAEILPKDTVNALFADDVGILATAPTIEAARAKAQTTVDIVSEWSKEWRLSLNSSKSESSLFTTNRKEAKESAAIFIDKKKIGFNKTPKFLGVYLDRELTFVKHIAEIMKRTQSKQRMLSALSHTDWGCRKQDLMKVYITHVRSVMDYAASGWQPWLATTNMEALEVVQNKALRIVTGNVKNARVSARRKEAGTPSYATLSKRSTLRSVEKAVRLPGDHPRKLALCNNPVPRKNTRRSWRQVGYDLGDKFSPASTYERQPFTPHARPPWETPNNLVVHESVPGISSKADSADTLMSATLEWIRALMPSLVIYTDGSASAGTTDGGAGVVVTQGDPASPVELQSIRVRGAPRTSSYEEEAAAMNAALAWISNNCGEAEKVVICTDSLSLCQALNAMNEDVDQLTLRIAQCKAEITIQWVPAHCGVPGNEAADQAAKDATKLDEESRAVSFASECARIRQAIQDPPPTDPGDIRIHEIYSAYNKSRDDAQVKTRADEVNLARLRARKHPSLRDYQHLLNESVDATCTRCQTGVEDLEHWLHECDAMAHRRMRVFGRPVLENNILTLEPGRSLALARASILRKKSKSLDAASSKSC